MRPAFALRAGVMSRGLSSAASLAATIASYSGAMAETEDANFFYYDLTSSGTLTVSADGLVQAAMIGPGGPGGPRVGGGGGCGEYVPQWTQALTAGDYTISVGTGGVQTGYTSAPTQGAPATAFGVTAIPGGVGWSSAARQGASMGGFNAGAGTNNLAPLIAGYGLGGASSSNDNYGGGGGGISGDGGSVDGASVAPGAGGAGTTISFLGTPFAALSGGIGGSKDTTGDGVAGAPNTGSGGGGASKSSTAVRGGLGGTGRVMLRIPKSEVYSITIAEPPIEGYVYALGTGLVSASVPVSGTYQAQDGVMQVRVVNSGGTEVVAWTSIGTVTGGTFSGTITVPVTDDALFFQARMAADTTQTFTHEDNFKVGVRILLYGQSNSIRAATTNESADAQPDYGLFYAADADYNVTPTGAGYKTAAQTIGDGVVAMMTELNSQLGCAVFVIAAGQGATPATGLADGTTPFTEIETALAAIGGPIHAIEWMQGEQDAANTHQFTPTVNANTSNYTTAVAGVHSDIVALTGQAVADVPFVLSGLATYDLLEGDVINTDAKWSAFKDMQKTHMPAVLTNVHFTAPWDDCVRLDEYHGYGLSYARRTKRSARHIAYLLGGATDPGTFEIASAVATDGETTTVTVSHGLGTDIAFGSLPHELGDGAVDADTDCTSFLVTAGAWEDAVVATGVRTNGTTITLTHATISTTGRKLRYFYGLNPTGGVVIDNSAYATPLAFESDFTVAAP